VTHEPRLLTRALPAAVAALIFGLLAALGQAPWGLWFLAVPGYAGVVLVIANARGGRAAFLWGWLAGLAHFALCLSWIVEPFLVDAERHGWMAPFALIFMAGGLALFWGAAGSLAVAAISGRYARFWAIAVLMVAFDALRGYLFTGFPWALSGHIWIGTPVDQIAALGGALALSALTLELAAGLATAWARIRAGRLVRAAVVTGVVCSGLALSWGWGQYRLAQPVPLYDGVQVRLVQGNVLQHLKWQPDLVQGFFQRHLDLSQSPANARPDLVIWPESAAPFLLENPGVGLEMMAEAAQVPVVFGVDRASRSTTGERQYHNALAAIDTQGQVTAIYDKHHLVPFGEYIPVLGLFAEHWRGLAGTALSGYTAGPGPITLDLGDAGRVLPLICYEAVFARSLHTAERPDWILQVTNDAWFGTGIGPFQHLAQARLRAIESGLPLVRAANTGVSAVIDARGRSVAELGLGEMGALNAVIPQARPATPYTRTGDLLWTLLLGAITLWLAMRALRNRKRLTSAP